MWSRLNTGAGGNEADGWPGARDSLRFEQGFPLYGTNNSAALPRLRPIGWACNAMRISSAEALLKQKKQRYQKADWFETDEKGFPPGLLGNDGDRSAYGWVVNGHRPYRDKYGAHAFVNQLCNVPTAQIIIVPNPKRAIVVSDLLCADTEMSG